MNFEIIPLRDSDLVNFKKDMQAAFQKSGIDGIGDMEEEILPDSHIDRSLSAEGSVAYEALADGEMV